MKRLSAKSCAPRAGAFTLIELLLVVVIIAILAALLLPALQRARQQTRSVACLGNLRQLSMAFSLYSDDNGDYLPPLNAFLAYNANGTEKGYGMWNCLGPYTGFPQWAGWQSPPTNNDDPNFVKFDSYWGKYSQRNGLSRSIWGCPENHGGAQPFGDGYAESLYLQRPSGWGAANPRSWTFPRPAARINDADKAVHVADSQDWHLGSPTGVRQALPTGALNLYKHMTGSNLSFMDGHAQRYGMMDIVSQLTDEFRMP